MRLPRPVLAVLLTASLGLVASCGVKSGDEAGPGGKTSSDQQSERTTTSADRTTSEETTEDRTTSEPSSDDTTTDLTPEQDQMVQQLSGVYEKLGLNADDASCLAGELVQRLGSSGDPGDLSDPGTVMDAANTCGITAAELAKLGASSDGTPEGAFKVGLETSFEAAGMTTEQATCAAEGYVQQYGMDPSASTDPQKMLALFDSCGVDPSKLNGG
jgi:hypothetical protein